MATPRQLRFKILWRLYHLHYWGRRHTPKENLPKGLPSHEKGMCFEVISDLVREGILIRKKTKHGDDLSLNPLRAKEILEFIESFSTEGLKSGNSH